MEVSAGMSRRQRKLIATESVLAGVTGLLAILTAVWPDWTELLFRWDPDHHSGGAELAVIVVLACLCLVSGAAARWQAVRRGRLAAAPGR
jgi:hypothetical protein